jgi:hypothetical protein
MPRRWGPAAVPVQVLAALARPLFVPQVYLGGDQRGPGQRSTYPLSCSLMAARASRLGASASGGVSFPELPGSPKVERRRRPGSQPKALRRSGAGWPGGRAGGTAGEGALRAYGAGLGWAPPPPRDQGNLDSLGLGSWGFQNRKKKEKPRARGKGFKVDSGT